MTRAVWGPFICPVDDMKHERRYLCERLPPGSDEGRCKVTSFGAWSCSAVQHLLQALRFEPSLQLIHDRPSRDPRLPHPPLKAQNQHLLMLSCRSYRSSTRTLADTAPLRTPSAPPSTRLAAWLNACCTHRDCGRIGLPQEAVAAKL